MTVMANLPLFFSSDELTRWIWKTPAGSPAQTAETAPKEAPSDRVKAWNGEIDQWANQFLESLEADISGEYGVFRESFQLKEASEFRALMKIRVKATKDYLKKRMLELDQGYALSLQGDEQFDAAAEQVLEETEDALHGLKNEVVDMAAALGEKEGDRRKLDTYLELWLFNQNVIRLRTETLPMNPVDLAGDAESLAPQVKSSLDPLAPILSKIIDDQTLTDGDYQTIWNGLKTVTSISVDTTQQSKAMESVKTLERAGALLPLHVMSPRERFELGYHIVKEFKAGRETKEKTREAILFLSRMDFLDIEQTEQLLGYFNEFLSEDEIQFIQKCHETLQNTREMFAKLLKKGESHNILLHYGTASNLLIYEVTGRLALLGAALPLLLNIGSPGKWPDILSDPAWLASVALGAASVEHITGGFGEGAVTKAALRFSETGEELTEQEETDRWTQAKQQELDHLCGNNPEAIYFLRKNEAEILKKIQAMAQDYEQKEDTGTYQFRFKDLVEYDLEKGKEAARKRGEPWFPADEAKAREQLGKRYRKGLDGVDTGKTEKVIREVYYLLAHDLKQTTVPDMLQILDEGYTRRGL